MAKKGDIVFYVAPAANRIVEAKVLKAKRTGACDVEARFFIGDGGRPTTGYLGYKFTDVTVYPNAKAADDEISARKRYA